MEIADKYLEESLTKGSAINDVKPLVFRESPGDAADVILWLLEPNDF
jgi:hypothetical protein